MAIDLAPLLAPLDGASTCGDDMLFSNDFDEIQHARRFDDPSLDQGEWVTEIKEANWSLVIERCTELLSKRTKDLRVAAWLTEALAIKQGMSGLTQGYTLLNGLCAQYWDEVHPLAEGEDTEYRLGNVTWLLARTAQLLREMPLTQTSSASFTAIDWEVASNVAQAIKRDPDHAEDIARGKPSFEQIDAAKRATPVPFYRALLADLKAFEAAMLALEQELETRAQDAAPSFRQVKDSYAFVHGLAERFARDVGVSVEVPSGSPTQPPSAPSVERAEPTFKTPLSQGTPMVSTQPARHSGAIQSRADAVAQLRAVAQFLRATEPHSPAAYLADKAAEWADMPLHRWLAAVVKDDGSLAHLRELLGVKPDAQ
jgi:type VI secretion system protein ImpA